MIESIGAGIILKLIADKVIAKWLGRIPWESLYNMINREKDLRLKPAGVRAGVPH